MTRSHSILQALLVNPARRAWVGQVGCEMIAQIIVQAGVDPTPFRSSWDSLMQFLEHHARRGMLTGGGGGGNICIYSKKWQRTLKLEAYREGSK